MDFVSPICRKAAKPYKAWAASRIVLIISAVVVSFPHVQALQSQIDLKYQELRNEGVSLGAPLDEERGIRDREGRLKGRFRHYQEGSIYWSEETGAHEVHGLIRERWKEFGLEQSFLGYPLSDESKCRTPDPQDRFQVFQGGRLYWRSGTGMAIVISNPTRFGEDGNCLVGATTGSPVPRPDRSFKGSNSSRLIWSGLVILMITTMVMLYLRRGSVRRGGKGQGPTFGRGRGVSVRAEPRLPGLGGASSDRDVRSGATERITQGAPSLQDRHPVSPRPRSGSHPPPALQPSLDGVLALHMKELGEALVALRDDIEGHCSLVTVSTWEGHGRELGTVLSAKELLELDSTYTRIKRANQLISAAEAAGSYPPAVIEELRACAQEIQARLTLLKQAAMRLDK